MFVCVFFLTPFLHGVEATHKRSYRSCECEMRMQLVCCWFLSIEIVISSSCPLLADVIHLISPETIRIMHSACLCPVRCDCVWNYNNDRMKAKRWLHCLSTVHECSDIYLVNLWSKKCICVFQTMQANEMFSYIFIVRFATLTLSMYVILEFSVVVSMSTTHTHKSWLLSVCMCFLCNQMFALLFFFYFFIHVLMISESISIII